MAASCLCRLACNSRVSEMSNSPQKHCGPPIRKIQKLYQRLSASSVILEITGKYKFSSNQTSLTTRELDLQGCPEEESMRSRENGSGWIGPYPMIIKQSRQFVLTSTDTGRPGDRVWRESDTEPVRYSVLSISCK